MEANETKEAKVELTKKMKDVMETIGSMTVLELADLVKALEEKFGVQAAAAMAMPMAGAAAGAAAAAPAEEKTSFNVVLASAGASKIQVIKELRALTSLGLKEAKDLVDAAPKTIKEGATKEEADKIKKQLEAAGAKIELK
ncbi:MAG: 50S ribosomal protein L7/L12 [Candidatus Omnitrophota bacterium]